MLSVEVKYCSHTSNVNNYYSMIKGALYILWYKIELYYKTIHILNTQTLSSSL